MPSGALLLWNPQHNQRLSRGLLNLHKCLGHCCMCVTDLTGLHQPLELGTSGDLWVQWETAPALHSTRNTLLKGWYGEEGEIYFFSPVIVDNIPRHDAFEAEVQEKVQGFHPVLLLPAGIKTLHTEKRTYTCKHLTTTSGFPVCLLFWGGFFCLFSFVVVVVVGFVFYFVCLFFLHIKTIVTPLSIRKGQEGSI